MRRTNMHLDSCSLTTAHALLPGDYCISSSLSRRMPVRWHAAELTVKLRSTDRLLSLLCARTVCWVIYCFNHTGHPTHLPNASFLYAVSPHISVQNCTSWQWCFLIFSTRVNLVKQDGPRFHKYRRRKRYCYRGRTSLLVLYTGFKGSILQ